MLKDLSNRNITDINKLIAFKYKTLLFRRVYCFSGGEAAAETINSISQTVLLSIILNNKISEIKLWFALNLN